MQKKKIRKKSRSGFLLWFGNLHILAKVFFGLLALLIVLSIAWYEKVSQPVHATSAVQYGFTVHTLYEHGSTPPGFNLSAFESNIDDLAAHNITWARVDLWPDVVAPSGSVSAINWNQNALSNYDTAIAYAKQKGLKIYFDTYIPHFASTYSLKDYETVTKNFYDYIANRYSKYVDIWQVFNEPNWVNFQTGQTIQEPYTSQYVSDYNNVLGTARLSIKTVNPSAIVTYNLAGLSGVDENPFIQGTLSNIDMLGIDYYPGTSSTKLSADVSKVSSLQQTYQKPVIVVETGMCSSDNGTATQAQYVPAFIKQFSSVNPYAVFVYQYQDTPGASSACEGSFGIVDVNGNQKPAYATTMAIVQPPTPTPIPYATQVTNDGALGYFRLSDITTAAAGVKGSFYINNPLHSQPGALKTDSNTSTLFNGINQYVDIPYNTSITNYASFSVEAWAYVTAGSGKYRGVVADRKYPDGWVLYANSSNQWSFWINNGTGMSALNGPAVASNTWVYMVGTYNSTTKVATFYVNGQQVASASISSYTRNPQSHEAIGQGEPGSNFYFPGKVDEVAIYSKALSASQILSHYKAAGY